MRLYFLFFLVIFSCKKTEQNTTIDPKDKPSLSVVQAHKMFDKVSPNFENKIEDWKSLHNVTVFLERFKKASANEILSNALELKGLSKSLKDSIKPDLFNLPSVNARLNIFHNESLRLADMTNIPAITAVEVHNQTDKVIDAFSSINSKVNTIFIKKRFEESIDIDVSYIGLDTTKIDSVSRKSINKRLEKLDDKQPRKPKLKRKQQ